LNLQEARAQHAEAQHAECQRKLRSLQAELRGKCTQHAASKALRQTQPFFAESAEEHAAREQELALHAEELESMLHDTARGGGVDAAPASAPSVSSAGGGAAAHAELLQASMQLAASVIEARNPAARVKQPIVDTLTGSVDIKAASFCLAEALRVVQSISSAKIDEGNVAGDCATQ